MKPFAIGILAWIFIFQACRNPAPPPEPKKEEVKKDYFPVADFIRGEINYVDSTPLAILKYNIRDGRADSGYIQPPAFDLLAREFLPRELEDSTFQRAFTESSFIDQTTRSATFTYSTNDSSISLKRVDVVASPGNSGADHVSSLYMEKTIEKGDTTIQKKMFWRSKKSFLIVTILEPTGRDAVSSQLKVVWDDRQ